MAQLLSEDIKHEILPTVQNISSVISVIFLTNAAINIDQQEIIKLKADGITVSACGDFNVSRVIANSQTSKKQEAPFIAHRA